MIILNFALINLIDTKNKIVKLSKSNIKIATLNVQILLTESQFGLLSHSFFSEHVLFKSIISSVPFSPHVSTLNLIDHSVCHVGLSVGVQSG